MNTHLYIAARTFVLLGLFVFIYVGMTTTQAAVTEGLVGRWDFNEGAADIARDTSGHGNDGKITGAQWVKCGKGYALEFKNLGDRVNCGAGPSLDLQDAVSVEAWVYRKVSVHDGELFIVGKSYDSFALMDYKRSSAYWYISHRNYPDNNHIHYDYEPKRWTHMLATFDGTRMRLYYNGVLVNYCKSKFPKVGHAGALLIGSGFIGLIDDVRVYNRALSAREVQLNFKDTAGDHGMDTTWFNKLRMTPYYYADPDRVVLTFNYRGLFPLYDAAMIRLTLGQARPKFQEHPLVFHRQVIDLLPPSGLLEVTVPLVDLPAGEYKFEANFVDETDRSVFTEAIFSYPPLAASVPAPAASNVVALPPPAAPVPYDLEVAPAGGFRLKVRGETFPFDSWYSYPHGGENKLTTEDRVYNQGEKDWRVTVHRDTDSAFRVNASGTFYSIERRIEAHPTHVKVRDTISNVRGEDLGVILHNHLRVAGMPFTNTIVTGNVKSGELAAGGAFANIYLATQRAGLGIIALDDVYALQSCVYAEKDRAGISTDSFGLAPNASYTFEWAVYPDATGDYYDFVNAVRRAEGINGHRVDAAYGFKCQNYSDRTRIPTKDYFDIRGLKYASLVGLVGVADDPGFSADGLDFMMFPQEMGLIKETLAAMRQRAPGVKFTFHVAPGLHLFNINQPDPLADSRVIGPDGKHPEYGSYHPPYMSEERFKEGWRLGGYYPMNGNSLHAMLIKSVDVMMDEIGCDGVYFDGAVASQVTYDRWDGHTVEIDPQTKTIRRKLAFTSLLSEESWLEYMRKIKAKGGFFFCGMAGLRRLMNEANYIWAAELTPGRYCHLMPTPIVLGSTFQARREVEIYYGVLDNLKWGLLYFYVGEGQMTRPSIQKQMYPITFEEIRPGCVKGKERIVTMNTGVCGWYGDRNLHFTYHYDDRGALSNKKFLTTVDAAGVRTEVALGDRESAVVKKIPVILETAGAVNLMVEAYDQRGIRLALNGNGPVKIVMSSGGDFSIEPNAAYRVESGVVRTLNSDAAGQLTVPLGLAGERRVLITKVITAKK